MRLLEELTRLEVVPLHSDARLHRKTAKGAFRKFNGLTSLNQPAGLGRGRASADFPLLRRPLQNAATCLFCTILTLGSLTEKGREELFSSACACGLCLALPCLRGCVSTFLLAFLLLLSILVVLVLCLFCSLPLLSALLGFALLCAA